MQQVAAAIAQRDDLVVRIGDCRQPVAGVPRGRVQAVQVDGRRFVTARVERDLVAGGQGSRVGAVAVLTSVEKSPAGVV